MPVSHRVSQRLVRTPEDIWGRRAEADCPVCSVSGPWPGMRGPQPATQPHPAQAGGRRVTQGMTQINGWLRNIKWVVIFQVYSVKDLFSARGRYLNIYLSIVSLDEKTVEHSLFYAFKDIYNSRCSSCPCSPLTRYLLFPSNVHQHGPWHGLIDLRFVFVFPVPLKF